MMLPKDGDKIKTNYYLLDEIISDIKWSRKLNFLFLGSSTYQNNLKILFDNRIRNIVNKVISILVPGVLDDF